MVSGLIFVDMVREAVHTVGAGPVSPCGAIAPMRRFASMLSDGDRFFYRIEGAAVFEVGIGTWSRGTIERAPLASSAGRSAVELPHGAKTIAIAAASDVLREMDGDCLFAAWRAIPCNDGRSVSEFLEQMAI